MERHYFHKIIKCINSCENTSQIQSCWRMIDLYTRYLLNTDTFNNNHIWVGYLDEKAAEKLVELIKIKE